MPGPIIPISSVPTPAAIRPAGSSTGASFQDVFTGAVQRVEGLGKNAEDTVERFLSGENEDLHTAVLSVTQADLALNLFLQTRNKVVSAYQEIMRLQL